MNRKSKSSSEKQARAVLNALYFMVILSRFHIPSKDLLDAYEQWLNILKDDE